MRHSGLAVVLALAAAVAAPACGNKDAEEKKAAATEVRLAQIEGLAAVPAEATVVLGADVRALTRSTLASRALDQMLLRDPELGERLERLENECKLDPSEDLEEIVLGMGSLPSAGTRAKDVVLAASGNLVEAEIVACVQRALQAEGGRVITKLVAGRTFYRAQQHDGRSVWFTFGTPKTVVASSSRAWLELAVGDGDKITSRKDLAELIATASEGQLWAAGLVEGRVGEGLVKLTHGKVAEPPRAMYARLDLEDGLSGVLGVVMAGDEDANAAVSFVKPQMTLAAAWAQERALGPLVSKVGVDAEGPRVYLRLSLDDEELAEVLSQIDTDAPTPQNSAPPDDRPEGGSQDRTAPE